MVATRQSDRRKQGSLSARRKKGRSAVTNLASALPGAPSRERWARRFRDLVALLISDLGNDPGMSEGQRMLARRAATLALECEVREVKFAKQGAATDEQLEVFQRATNSLRRTLESLNVHHGRIARDVTPTLAELIEQHTHVDSEVAK